MTTAAGHCWRGPFTRLTTRKSEDAAAESEHLFRSSGGVGMANLGAYTMRSIFVAFLFSFSICAVVAAADAQPSALAVAAGAVRVPMLFTGAVEAGPPPPPQCHPGDFARGEAAARIDVAKMDAYPQSVPALRRKGWPAPGYARCVHCVNARSASGGGVRGARRPLPLPAQSDVPPRERRSVAWFDDLEDIRWNCREMWPKRGTERDVQ